MPFNNVILSAPISQKAQGGPCYQTTVIAGETGVEQRNVNWLDALNHWTIQTGLQQDVDIAAIFDFYRAQQGKLYGFLIQDPADYQATGQFLGTGDGATTQFQLVKHYVCEVVEDRPITRVVGGSATFYVNGVVSTSASLNASTGVVSFTPAPASGAVITADFQFYVPVRFDSDTMGAQWQWTSAEWANVPIVEIREQASLPVASAAADPTNSRFPTSLTGQTGGPMFDTFMVPVGSGYEERGARWAGERLRWDLVFDTMTPAMRDALIAFFRAHKGRAYPFRFRDWRDYNVVQEPAAALTSTTFQIQHIHTSSGISSIRTITKPVAGTVQVFNGTAPVASGWTVDTNTGIITFSVAPGYVPTVSCQFDLLCRFDTDQLIISIDDLLVASVSGLAVMEVSG